MDLSRRQAFTATSAALFSTTLSGIDASVFAADPDHDPKIGLSFGTYGMRSLAPDRALQVCAHIGYDGVELSLLEGWPTDPRALSHSDRTALRDRIGDLGLALPSLLESLPCLRSKQSHLQNLEKLKRATELARELAPEHPPVVQSIVGAKPDQWESSKNRLADELSQWSRVGESDKTFICFKPHAGHIVQTPERAAWIHRQVDSPWLKIVFDYSHYALSGLPISSTLESLLPVTAFVQVKDSSGTTERPRYLLPGDGTTNYLELFSTLKRNRYQGFVGVEISSQIHRESGYDPESTAKICYQRLAPIFDQAGIRRP